MRGTVVLQQFRQIGAQLAEQGTRGEIHISDEGEVRDLVGPVAAHRLLENPPTARLVEHELGDAHIVGIVHFRPRQAVDDLRMDVRLTQVNQNAQDQFVVAVVVKGLRVKSQRLTKLRAAELLGKLVDIDRLELVAKGEIELGMVVITQIMTTSGVDLVGSIPHEVQSYVRWSGAVSTKSQAPQVAKDLIKFLTGPTALPVLKAQGMEPG